jgi:hypothetical protein
VRLDAPPKVAGTRRFVKVKTAKEGSRKGAEKEELLFPEEEEAVPCVFA